MEIALSFHIIHVLTITQSQKWWSFQTVAVTKSQAKTGLYAGFVLFKGLQT